MKTKAFTIWLFLALCLAISLPAVYQVANTSALQGGYVGPAVEEESGYYEVGSDCVLYHAYWDGTATDHSTYGNDGTVIGATFVENGLSFDGSDDYVMCPNDMWEDRAYNDMTIIIWANNGVAGNRYMLRKYSTAQELAVAPYAGTLYWDFGDQSNGRLTKAMDVGWYGAWKMFSFTSHYDGANNSQEIRVNDVSQSSDATAVSWTPTYEGLMTTIIGASGASTLPWLGIMGEVYIFESILTTEITNIFNATKARYGVASLDPKYRNYLYAQEKKHEKSSLYRVPRNVTISSTMRGTRGVTANHGNALFQNASRQRSVGQTDRIRWAN